MILKKCK